MLLDIKERFKQKASKMSQDIINKLRSSKTPSDIIKRCESKSSRISSNIIKGFESSKILLSISKR